MTKWLPRLLSDQMLRWCSRRSFQVIHAVARERTRRSNKAMNITD